MKGKKYCASKQIPESILLQTTASVLGLEEFDEETFAAAIEHIHVTGPNSLRYIFRDGQEREVVWQDHSRRDSWTDDMRMQAAAHARRRYDHEWFSPPFQTEEELKDILQKLYKETDVYVDGSMVYFHCVK